MAETVFKISPRVKVIIARNKFGSLSCELQMTKFNGGLKILYLNWRTLDNKFSRSAEIIALAQGMNIMRNEGETTAISTVNFDERKGVQISTFNDTIYITIETFKDEVKVVELSFSFTISEYAKFMSFDNEIRALMMVNLQEMKKKKIEEEIIKATTENVTLHGWVAVHTESKESVQCKKFHISRHHMLIDAQPYRENPEWIFHDLKKTIDAPTMRMVFNAAEGQLLKQTDAKTWKADCPGCVCDRPNVDEHTVEDGCLEDFEKIHSELCVRIEPYALPNMISRMLTVMGVSSSCLKQAEEATPQDKLLILSICWGLDSVDLTDEYKVLRGLTEDLC